MSVFSSMVDRRLLILYGSQTGCAQEVAERIWRESKWLHYSGPVIAMDDYPLKNLIFEKRVIFICSTTGQGDQPDNMKTTWKFLLRKSLPQHSLSDLEFAVLGMGDSSYEHFNYVAKKLFRRLTQLGGKALCDIGLADDQHDLGPFAVIDPWINNLWNVLIEKHPLTDGLAPMDRNSLPPPKWNIYTLNGNTLMNDKLPNSDLLQTNSTIVTCLSNTRTTAESHFQDVRLLKFEYKENSINYFPGDVVMVRPINSEKSVENFFKLLSENKNIKLEPVTVLNVTERSNDMPIPYNLRKPFTLYQCVKYYWDLNIVPNRYTFQLLSYFTDSQLEKEKLQEFITPEGQDELFNYCNRPRRTILEVLTDFPYATANLSLEYLFEVFSPIHPRAFSIASAPSVHINEIHLLVAVVSYKTKLLTKRTGLCSTWLASLKCNDHIPIWVKKGTFKFPFSPLSYVIMVGPGTGVAPFRSYIHEAIAKGSGNSKTLHLYFGARNKLGDFHCVNDWKKLEADGKLSLYTAFSRDQDHKIYIQHILEQNGEELFKLLENKENCYVFVAGNAKNMPTAVQNVFVNLFETFGHLSQDASKNVIETMKAHGTYQTETWS